MYYYKMYVIMRQIFEKYHIFRNSFNMKLNFFK